MTALGDAIRAALAERHWTQVDLSAILGRPTQHVNSLIQGIRGLTPQSAAELSEAFGNDPMDWVRLDIQDRLAKTPHPDAEGIKQRRAAVELRYAERPTVQATATRIEALAHDVAQATDRDTITRLIGELRASVARLPHRNVGRPRQSRGVK